MVATMVVVNCSRTDRDVDLYCVWDCPLAPRNAMCVRAVETPPCMQGR